MKADLGELIVLVQRVPRAYLRIIRTRGAQMRKGAGLEPGPAEEKTNA